MNDMDRIGSLSPFIALFIDSSFGKGFTIILLVHASFVK